MTISLFKRKSAVAQMLSVLKKFGSDAHLYLPGVGVISGVTAGNYLDSVGTTVASVDGLVGLVKDGAGSVGAELFSDANVTFTGESSKVSSGVYRVYSSAGALSAVKPLAVTSTKTYLVEFTVDSVTLAGAGLSIDGGVSTTVPATVGRKSAIVINPIYAEIFIRRASGATDIQISGVSVREVTSIHATQATTGNKPVLRRGLVNMQLHNREFTLPYWTTTRAALLIGQPDHLGGNGAVKIVEDSTAANSHVMSAYSGNQPSYVAGNKYTAAFVVKKGERDGVRISLSSLAFTSNVYAQYGLSTGRLFSKSATVNTTKALLDNDWYLLTITDTATITSTGSPFSAFCAVNDGDSISYNGDGTSGIYVSTVGHFDGEVTAQQILDAGGIPVTTAAPASSSVGAYKWVFDGVDDLLNITIPVGYESSTIIDVPSNGQIVSDAQNIIGTYTINSTTYGRVILKTQPSAADLATIKLGLKIITGIT